MTSNARKQQTKAPAIITIIITHFSQLLGTHFEWFNGFFGVFQRFPKSNKFPQILLEISITRFSGRGTISCKTHLPMSNNNKGEFPSQKIPNSPSDWLINDDLVPLSSPQKTHLWISVSGGWMNVSHSDQYHTLPPGYTIAEVNTQVSSVSAPCPSLFVSTTGETRKAIRSQKI